MYALVVTCVFLLVPLAYFYYEEKDEEMHVTRRKRCIGAVKFTLGFLIVMAILMAIGAFALSRPGDRCGKGDSTWNGVPNKKGAKCNAQFAEHALTDDGGNNALSFTVGALTVLGFLYFVYYTGYAARSARFPPSNRAALTCGSRSQLWHDLVAAELH